MSYDIEEKITVVERIGNTPLMRVEFLFLFNPDHDDVLDAPRLDTCRFAVLPIPRSSGDKNYAIYDRLLSRVVDGMYALEGDALHIAAKMNVPGHKRSYTVDPPSEGALGLLYPDPLSED